MGTHKSVETRSFPKFLLIAALLLATAFLPSQTIAADLPLASGSPLAGFAFDDRPLQLPPQRNFQMAMITASSELGRSCGRMESYGWRMSQTEQSRVNQIFNSTVDRLRGLGYVVETQTPASVSRDITMFTADRTDKHFIVMWSAGEIGLVMVLCQASPPLSGRTALGPAPSVQTFPEALPAIQKSTLDAPVTHHAPLPRFSPVGEWIGTYTCEQGITGGTLQISSLNGENFDGVFHFYPTPKNPNVATGSYSVYGQYDRDSHRILINPGKWIQRPANYYNTVIVGSFDPLTNTFSSYFQGITGCTSFEAKLKNDSYVGMPDEQPIQRVIKKKRKKIVKKKTAPVMKPAASSESSPATGGDTAAQVPSDAATATTTTTTTTTTTPASAADTGSVPTATSPVIIIPPAASVGPAATSGAAFMPAQETPPPAIVLPAETSTSTAPTGKVPTGAAVTPLAPAATPASPAQNSSSMSPGPTVIPSLPTLPSAAPSPGTVPVNPPTATAPDSSIQQQAVPLPATGAPAPLPATTNPTAPPANPNGAPTTSGTSGSLEPRHSPKLIQVASADMQMASGEWITPTSPTAPAANYIAPISPQVPTPQLAPQAPYAQVANPAPLAAPQAQPNYVAPPAIVAPNANIFLPVAEITPPAQVTPPPTYYNSIPQQAPQPVYVPNTGGPHP
jgi:hypothetical protein